MTEILKSELLTLFTFSQSSLQDYSDCARRFQLRYIEQLLWPAVESEPAAENERRQQAGQMFHRMVQQLLIGLPAEKLAQMANTPELKKWWDNFTARGPNLKDCRLYPETTLSSPLGAQRVTAKYDLIAVQPDGKAVIFDWKTYHKRPRDEAMAARWQTRIYRALLVRAGAHLNGGQPFTPEQVEMVYWYADFPAEAARLHYDEAQSRRDWDDLEKIAAEISARREFALTDDEKKCAYCTYRSYCNRGTTPGSLDETEDELSSLDITLEQVAEIEF